VVVAICVVSLLGTPTCVGIHQLSTGIMSDVGVCCADDGRRAWMRLYILVSTYWPEDGLEFIMLG
jgi:hypothetical protein